MPRWWMNRSGRLCKVFACVGLIPFCPSGWCQGQPASAPQPANMPASPGYRAPFSSQAPAPGYMVPPQDSGYPAAPMSETPQPAYAVPPPPAGYSALVSPGPSPGPGWTTPYQRPGCAHWSLPARNVYPMAPYAANGKPTYPSPYGQMFPQSGTGYAAPGYVLPLILTTAISSCSSKAGSHVEATLAQNRALEGYGYLPAGSIVSGKITYVKHAGFLEKQGAVSVEFDQLKLPDGRIFPISGHLLGGLGPVGYGDVPSAGQRAGAGWGHRMENIGVSALASESVSGAEEMGMGYGMGYGMGAGLLSGLASPSTALGLAEVAGSALRRGRQVIIPAGQNFQFQLNTALTIPAPEPPPQTATGY